MQNTSLTQLTSAVRRLEADNIRNESYLTLVTKHETELRDVLEKIQKIQSDETDKKSISELTHTVKELTTRSIEDKNKVMSEFQIQVQGLKSDIIKAINDKPVMVTADDSEEPVVTERAVTISEFKSLDKTEQKYSGYVSLDDVLQIELGDTKISIDKDANDKEICSIENDFGGIAFRKHDSEDVWFLNRNKNSEMEFHYNTMESSPLAVSPDDVKISKLSLNGKSVSKIATAINDNTAHNDTIPTVSAVVNYVNTNLKRLNLLNAVGGSETSASVSTSTPATAPTEERNSESSHAPNCNISTINTGAGKSLLIENETNSISLKDNESNIVSISASLTDGLKVSNKFKLNNTGGILCKFIEDNGELTVGRFVELTGSVIEMDDLIIPEVKLTDKLSTMVYGVIKSRVQEEYVKDNKVYKLDTDNEYITIIKEGLIEIPFDEGGSFELGSLLVAGSLGVPTYNKNNAEAIKFCVEKKVPMAKVVSKLKANLVVDVV